MSDSNKNPFITLLLFILNIFLIVLCLRFVFEFPLFAVWGGLFGGLAWFVFLKKIDFLVLIENTGFIFLGGPISFIISLLI